jgi:topoisomerase-4 subunit A
LTSSGVSNELCRVEVRLHVVDGLLDALNRLDQVDSTVRLAKDRRAALRALQSEPYCYTQRQAEAVLDMPVVLQCTDQVARLNRERDELVTRRTHLMDESFEALDLHWFG